MVRRVTLVVIPCNSEILYYLINLSRNIDTEIYFISGLEN